MRGIGTSRSAMVDAIRINLKPEAQGKAPAADGNALKFANARVAELERKLLDQRTGDSDATLFSTAMSQFGTTIKSIVLDMESAPVEADDLPAA